MSACVETIRLRRKHVMQDDARYKIKRAVSIKVLSDSEEYLILAVAYHR